MTEQNNDLDAETPLIIVGKTHVLISSSMDFKSRIRDWWRCLRFKTFCKHIGLLVALSGYTILGGLIFRRFEHPAELSKIQYYSRTLADQRLYFIKTIINNTDQIDLETFISNNLNQYEIVLQASFKAGIPLGSTVNEIVKWTVLKSVFFGSTVLTTIGYGNIVPVTPEGKSFCVIFALVGIPLTMIVIADWGRLFASTLSTLIHHIPPLPVGIRNALVARRTLSYVLWSICLLFVYLAIGASLFVLWEDDWTFFDGFYFCFITMTTIGFGDLVPKKPTYMLLCTLYILVGLALTSTIIELVRRQYAQSWRQLQALRGPLTENLRKLAENAPGLDILAFQQDLMKVLTVVSMPRRIGNRKEKKDNNKNEQEWEEALHAVIKDMTTKATSTDQLPVVQIVIYESSV